MRHHGGSTNGDDANGFDDANIINKDDVGSNKAVTATNSEMDVVRTTAMRKTKTTATRPPESTASTTGWSHARAAKTAPGAPSPRCQVSPVGVPGDNKKVHRKEGDGNKDNTDHDNDDVAAAGNNLTGGSERARVATTKPMAHTFTVGPSW